MGMASLQREKAPRSSLGLPRTSEPSKTETDAGDAQLLVGDPRATLVMQAGALDGGTGTEGSENCWYSDPGDVVQWKDDSREDLERLALRVIDDQTRKTLPMVLSPRSIREFTPQLRVANGAHTCSENVERQEAAACAATDRACAVRRVGSGVFRDDPSWPRSREYKDLVRWVIPGAAAVGRSHLERPGRRLSSRGVKDTC